METEAKQQVDNSPLRMQDWRKQAVRWVVILGITAILYWVGGILNVWASIFPAVPILKIAVSLLLSWMGCFVLLVIYGVAISHLLIKSYVDGMKYIQDGNYEAGLEAFKEHYDFFDRHPQLGWVYTVLMLDSSKYGHREIALLNQAHAYIQLGNSAEVLRCYEECLALNPKNEMVTSSLNLAAAISGGEIRPMPGHVPYRAYVKRKRRGPWWQGCLSGIVGASLAACCSVPTFFAVGTLGGFWDDADITFAVIGTVLISLLLLRVMGWAVARLVLMDFYRGEQLLRKRQYREAVQSFQNQAAFLRENPWVDEWRWAFLPNSGPYSYQEWALQRMAYGYIQLGEGDRLLPLYEQMLDLNPRNGLAQTSINFIKLFRGEEESV